MMITRLTPSQMRGAATPLLPQESEDIRRAVKILSIVTGVLCLSGMIVYYAECTKDRSCIGDPLELLLKDRWSWTHQR